MTNDKKETESKDAVIDIEAKEIEKPNIIKQLTVTVYDKSVNGSQIHINSVGVPTDIISYMIAMDEFAIVAKQAYLSKLHREQKEAEELKKLTAGKSPQEIADMYRKMERKEAEKVKLATKKE